MQTDKQTITLHDVEDLYPSGMLLRTPLESRWMQFWRNYRETLASFFNNEDLPILLGYLTIIFISLFVLGFAINILQWMWTSKSLDEQLKEIAGDCSDCGRQHSIMGLELHNGNAALRVGCNAYSCVASGSTYWNEVPSNLKSAAIKKFG